MVVKEVPNVCVIHDWHKEILQAMNDIKRVVKKETEQPSGPMFIADGALGIWEQTSIANSRTSN
jgi:hypothetical protein